MLKRILIILPVAGLLGILAVPIPSPDMEWSKVLYDKSGHVLSAKVAEDGQWRFPVDENLPPDLKKAITLYEDAYFYYHPGINPVSIVKALWANNKAGRVVRGGSTITMQVMRMYRGNRSRTIKQKLIEVAGALKLELLYPKDEIMHMWASIAPFGGNTVGVQSAAIRYFNRQIDELSFAEYATLAVLPNTPSSIHLNKNLDELRRKRNLLLEKMHHHGIIDDVSLELAQDESLPTYHPMVDQKALHLLAFLSDQDSRKAEFYTTVDPHIQKSTEKIIQDYADIYQHDGIRNISAIIINNTTNELVAYVGNVHNNKGNIQYVDCNQGLRSYGSLLKPFLYAYALDKGYFLPEEKVKDIPTNINGFIPKNFDRKFRGMVPLSTMVSQSLNVPAVRTLNYVGVESFHRHLRNVLGLKSINADPYHHGLSLILGGAEATPWELTRLYKGLARNYYGYNHPYDKIKTLVEDSRSVTGETVYSNITLEHTLAAMSSLNRPEEEQQYQLLGGEPIAWKTGTSYGHRDAWSIGFNKQYTVTVWVGNETGEGMYDLTGVKKAAPILFHLMRILSSTEGLPLKQGEARSVKVCKVTGQMAGRLCGTVDTIFVHEVSHSLRQCNDHELSDTGDTLQVVDPVTHFYYERFYGRYSLPRQSTKSNFGLVYPAEASIIQVPRNLSGAYNQVIAEANAGVESGKLFWFLDNQFIGFTEEEHRLAMTLEEGPHKLYINDEAGNEEQIEFNVVRN